MASDGLEGGLYTGAAVFGRFNAVIGALVGLIIAIALVVAGYAKLRDPHTASVEGTVATVHACNETPATKNKPASYDCMVDIVYSVGNKAYKAVGIQISGAAPTVKGQKITLQYNPSDPKSAVYEISPRMLGWGLILGALLIGGVTTGIAYASFRSKAFAATYGAIAGISDLSQTF